MPSPVAGGSGIESEEVEIPVENGRLFAYLAKPEGPGRRPALLTLHENRGLTDHIRDCARRLASAGYVVLAPDLLSRQGGKCLFPTNEAAIAALKQTDPEQNTRDLIAALEWLCARSDVDGNRLGSTGWCMGGTYTWRLAARIGARIRAAVPWYGWNPPSFADITAPVFAIYGELDERVTAAMWEPATEQMRLHGKAFVKKIYPGAQHAFNNDTSARHNPEQAKIAWSDMLAFFHRHL